jgi:quinol monooxygenase YgiN
MNYIVVANWKASDGHEAEVREVLLSMIGPTQREAGCVEYRLHGELANPGSFLLYEAYTDEAAYRDHLASSHFQELAMTRGIPLLESRERAFYLELHE